MLDVWWFREMVFLFMDGANASGFKIRIEVIHFREAVLK